MPNIHDLAAIIAATCATALAQETAPVDRSASFHLTASVNGLTAQASPGSGTYTEVRSDGSRVTEVADAPASRPAGYLPVGRGQRVVLTARRPASMVAVRLNGRRLRVTKLTDTRYSFRVPQRVSLRRKRVVVDAGVRHDYDERRSETVSFSVGLRLRGGCD